MRTMNKLLLVLGMLLSTPTVSTAGNTSVNIDEIMDELEFKRRTSLPNIDTESLDEVLDEGECIGMTLDERQWSFFKCK